MQEEKLVTIYALTEQDDPQAIMYIGKTNNYRDVLSNTISHANKDKQSKNRLSRWVNNLLCNNEKPGILVLENCLENYWKHKYESLLMQYKLRDYSLINFLPVQNKGKKRNTPSWNKGLKMSAEYREKLSKAHAGQKWSEEQRIKTMKTKTERAFPITREFLIENYVNKGLIAQECANLLGCSKEHILYKLKQFNIPHNPNYHIKFSVSKERLYDLYVTQGKTKKQCGDILGCSDMSITNHLKKHGIAIRSIVPALDISKETLNYLYVEQKKNYSQCAKELNTSVTNIYKHIKKYGIKTRFEGSRGKEIKDSTRTKLRIHTIKMRQEGLAITGQKLHPFFNKDACKFFDYLNAKFKLNGKHAHTNGEYHIKELGYWVDYYEPNLNMVIEWNEKHHYTDKKRASKDKTRIKEIQDYLKCKMFFIDERKIKDLGDFESILNNHIEIKNFILEHKSTK